MHIFKYLGWIVLFFCFDKSQASHMFGADVTYKSLGGTKYKIIMNVYRDCRGISFSGPSAGVFGGTNGGNGCGNYNLFPSRIAIYDVSSVCQGGSKLCNPQNTYGTGDGIELHVYTVDVDFSTTPLNNFVNKSSCCEVTFYIGQCCRTGAVTTGSAGNDFYATCTINICNLSKCSSTVSSGPAPSLAPPNYFCCNQSSYYNNGFMDSIDGDSISYKLIPAFASLPQNSVSYSSPFSYQYPVTCYCVPPTTIKCSPNPYAMPPRGTFFDTTNGDFIYTPTKCDEVATINFEAKEWRKDTSGKYIWIGKVRRDVLFRVSDACGYNKTVRVDSIYEYRFCAGEDVKIRLNLKDQAFTPYQTKPDSIYITWNNAIPGANFKIEYDTAAGVKHAIFSWKTKPTDARDYKYHFVFSTTDSVCTNPTITHRSVNIYLKSKDTPDFSSSIVNCNTLKLTAVIGKKVTGTTTYNWVVEDSSDGSVLFTGSGNNITTGILKTATLRIRLNCNNPYFCMPEIVKYQHFINASPSVQLPADTAVCFNGDAYSYAKISGLQSNVTFKWWLNSALLPDTLQTITLKQNQSDKMLEVQVTDQRGCSSRDTQIIKQLPDPHVIWTKSLYQVCHDSLNVLLNKLVNIGDSTTTNIYCQDSKYMSYSGGNYYFSPNKSDNIFLQSASVEFKIYAAFTSKWHQCFSRDSSVIRINGNPIVEISDGSFCQDIGTYVLDSFIIKPKITFGITRTWKAISAPTGVNKAGLIYSSGGKLLFGFGSKTQTTYGGNYQFEYLVKNNTTGCMGRDTNKVTITNEALFQKTRSVLCEDAGAYSLNNSGLLDNNNIDVPPSSSYQIVAFNNSKTDPKVTGTTLTGGYIFPTSSAGLGYWTFKINAAPYGCPMSDTFSFSVSPAPVASFTSNPKDSTPISKPDFVLSNTSTISAGYLSYFWNFGTGNTADTSIQASPTINYPAKNAEYFVTLVATSDKKCRDTSVMRLQVGSFINGMSNTDLPKIWMNNQFQVQGISFRKLETGIFDASGKQVATLVNNGTITLPAGIYYYRVFVEFENGNTAMYKGIIHHQE
ncbi:MAG: hypothetical protein KG003_06735 [Bacteroidetes bacterium]|nr:hypothetical protein [Bacteroidota bacterium]